MDEEVQMLVELCNFFEAHASCIEFTDHCSMYLPHAREQINMLLWLSIPRYYLTTRH